MDEIDAVRIEGIRKTERDISRKITVRRNALNTLDFIVRTCLLQHSSAEGKKLTV